MTDMTEEINEKYLNMTPEELIEVLSKDDITEEDKIQIAKEMVKNIGIRVSLTSLLTTTRYLLMKTKLKCVVEEDGEVYVFELKKIADSEPDKGLRDHDRDISKTITVTIDQYE